MFFTVRFYWDGSPRVERVRAGSSLQAAEFALLIADPSCTKEGPIGVEVVGSDPRDVQGFRLRRAVGARYEGAAVG